MSDFNDDGGRGELYAGVSVHSEDASDALRFCASCAVEKPRDFNFVGSIAAVLSQSYIACTMSADIHDSKSLSFAIHA